MVFLNKSKINETVSTTASFNKPRPSVKIEKPEDISSLKVTDFHLGRKLGAGKFG